MTHYISKDSIVKEIDRLVRKYSLCPTHTDYEKALKEGRLIGYKDVLFKVNTSEVKEVDLEKELKKKIGNVGECDRHLAKYFFELGLNAQK